MQPHARLNSAMAKKLWNHMRVSFIMARKGLVSKRKLLMDLNLMIKRGKLFRKTFFNLTFQNHHHHPSRGLGRARARAGPQEYEFSCTNTPVFSARAKRKHYFPCITTVDEEEFDELFMIERSPLDSPVLDCEEEVGEEVVVVEVDEGRVDEEAEEFIRRFYEQLRLQRRLALLQYQEMEYREMLARGTN
ncbi:hypothetical protein QJS10_CPB04g00054 [Acorus calamus]|uniref:Uncharacterized protein n=1 Tax=Acorus calamus TaxID=4465 RepID=A0AAV9F383_ACOCL|nr:hypothetical protein QJS10_CPB04g00054 [Acorus calamus]